MSDIAVKIQEVKRLFSQHDNWEDRYRELISFGRALPELESELQIEKYRIKGCQSQVWLVPELKDKKVYFKAGSDAMLVKGIVGILVKVYNGEAPETILESPPHFLQEVGITEHLSMNRTNGLASMVKQIQLYAAAYKAVVAQNA